MSSRRKILQSLAAEAAAIPSALLEIPARPLGAEGTDQPCKPPRRGPHADYFPNLTVYTHENQRALFYDDLLAGKVVMINCMSIRNDALYPVTENLVQVQRLLGDQVGRDIFMYSLTVDPEHDTPQALRAFANQKGVGPGWLFLTGEPQGMQLLRGKLFAHSGGHHHAAGGKDCSMGLVRYGNEAVGLWGAAPAKSNPEWMAHRLTWVQPRKPPVGPPRRGGPYPPGSWPDR